jgi:ABC-type dipeptide/oligopeptide/nickel transport system permease component
MGHYIARRLIYVLVVVLAVTLVAFTISFVLGVLALLFAAIYARVVRGNMIDTMGEDYIRTARAKGLSERQVLTHHGMRAGR